MPAIFLSVFFRLLVCNNASQDKTFKQKFFFDLCFLTLAFFIIFIPLNKFIIITIITVIMPYFYLLLCHRPTRDKSQSVWAPGHCLITHLLCFKTVRNNFQQPWFHAHYHAAHLPGYILTRDILQHPWTCACLNCLITNLWCFKMVRDILE